MYRFYIGEAFTEIFPFYESNGIASELHEEQKFSRDTFSGDLTLKGDDYDTIKALSDTDPSSYKSFYVHKDDIEMYVGHILVNGKYNTIEKTCQLKVETDDEYSEIIVNQETEYDIINSDIDIVTCNVEAKKNTLEFSPTISDGFSAFAVFIDGGAPVNIFASEIFYAEISLANELIENSSFFELSEDNDVYKLGRIWDYSGEYESPLRGYFRYTLTEPTVDINTVIWENTYYSGVTTTELKKVVYTGEVTYDILEDVTKYWFLDTDYFDETNITYSRLRRLDDTIEWLIGQMDDTILFDDESFAYFNSNSDLKNLLIAGVTDILLNPAGTAQQDEGSTKGLLTFKSLVDLFSGHPFHLYWFLEDIDGYYYFRLKHITEIEKESSQIDLTNYLNRNWCEDKGGFSFKSEDFYGKYTISNTSGNVAFDDQTVTTNLANIENNYQKTIAKFYFDVWDIQNNPAKYPNLSVDQFVLLVANLGDGDNLVNYFVNSDAFNPYTNVISDANTKDLYLKSVDPLSQNAFAYSHDFSQIEGETYVVEFDSLVLTNGAHYLYLSSSSFPNVPNSNVETLQEGILRYEFVAEITDNRSLIFHTVTFRGVTAEITATNVRVYIKGVYQCTKSTSIRTGQEVMNANLSIANLLENHGKYEFCSTPVTMNLLSTDVGTLKIRQQETISIPIYNQNDIDFSKLVTTNFGDVEAESLAIKFNSDYAQFKGKF